MVLLKKKSMKKDTVFLGGLVGGRVVGWRAGVTNELEREIEKGTRVSYRCAWLRSRRVFRELCSSLILFRLFVRSFAPISICFSF
jgi:hypothetical protein